MKSVIKLITLITLLLLLLFNFANAQTPQFEWVNTLGAAGNNDAVATTVIVDSNKSVISCGAFTGTVDFNPGSAVNNLVSHGDYDIFIVKYDTGGNFIWARNIGGAFDDMGKSVRVDKQGNIFVLGTFQNTVDFDPGPGIVNITSQGVNTCLLKLDPNGNFVWVKTILAREPETLSVDNNNNLVIDGLFAGTRDFDPGPAVYNMSTVSAIDDDFFVLKLDHDGNFLWARQFSNQGGAQIQTWNATTDTQNNILFSGNFTGTVDFDPGPGTMNYTAGFDDTFILELDAQGNFIWVKVFGGIYADKIWSVRTDSHGNIYATGEFGDTVDFDPGPGTFLLTASVSTDGCFILKLDANGNFVYAKKLDGGIAHGRSVAIDIADNIYIAGEGYVGTDLDPGAGTYILNSGATKFALKLDPNGNFIWGAGFNSQGNTFGSVYSDLTVDALKNVYFAGDFPSPIDWDPTTSVHIATPNGNYDAYMLKLSQCHNSLKVITTQSCSTYTLNGITYTGSGEYYQTLTNSVGCDSIIQLYLVIGNVTHQVSITTCDSYTFNGNVLTSSGNYSATFPLPNGCDSIVQLDLTITTITSQSNITVCNSYLFNGNLLTTSGTYSATILLPNGCDSIAQLTLTVNKTIAPGLGEDATLCNGDSLLLSAGNYSSYLWNDGSTTSNLWIYEPGSYSVTVTGSNGCPAADTIKILPSDKCGSDCSLTIETKLFPNPFNEFLLVRKNPTSCIVKMNVYNEIGQLVIKAEQLHDGDNFLSFKALANGVYFYRMYADGKILRTGKIAKGVKY